MTSYAGKREASGVVHLLGVPREVLVVLYNAFQRLGRTPGYGDEERRIFGAETYTFDDGSAPALREFGTRKTSARQREKALAELPDELQEIIEEEQRDYKYLFGFYTDARGRIFKLEGNEHLSVKYLAKIDELANDEMIAKDDVLTIKHTVYPDYTLKVYVDEILSRKSRIVLMKCTFLSSEDPHKERLRHR